MICSLLKINRKLTETRRNQAVAVKIPNVKQLFHVLFDYINSTECNEIFSVPNLKNTTSVMYIIFGYTKIKKKIKIYGEELALPARQIAINFLVQKAILILLLR